MNRLSVAAIARDPTPVPTSSVTCTGSDVPGSVGRPGVLIDYFAAPTPEALALESAIGAAYEEGRSLYGDEDSDAWLAALENGTHPLCQIKTAAAPS